jgi:hypothetical protein
MLRYESQQAQHSVKETHCSVLYRHAASHCKRFTSRHNNVNILSRNTSSEGFIKHIWHIASIYIYIYSSCFSPLTRWTYTATALTVKHTLIIILNYECNLCKPQIFIHRNVTHLQAYHKFSSNNFVLSPLS